MDRLCRWTAFGLLLVRFGAAEDVVELKIPVPKEIQAAAELGPARADEPMRLGLVIRLDQALLNETLNELYGSGASEKRHFLSSAEFASRFGISGKRETLKAFAKSSGFTIDLANDDPKSMVVKVAAEAAVVEKTFGIRLHRYLDRQGRAFLANDRNPTIPVSLAPHLAYISGLSTLTGVARPAISLLPGIRLGSPGPSDISGGTAPNGALAPADIRAIYVLGVAPGTGAGQTVALAEMDGYIPADSAAYETQFNLPSTPLTFVGVDGQTPLCGLLENSPCNNQTYQSETQTFYSGMAEVALDIQMVEAIAPGVNTILVYQGPNSAAGILAIYNQIATDNLAQGVSTSWLSKEEVADTAYLQSESQIFQRMAAQGQSMYAASGDSGAYGPGPTTNSIDPASQPYVTAIGGTSLFGTVQAPVEIAWGGSGGGISGFWPLPSYQVGTPGLASEQYRNIPDAALNADPNSGYGIYVGGTWQRAGGTSAAAPLWAGLTALINQQRTASSIGWLGFANPTLYRLGNSHSYSASFRDITAGTNGSFNAVTGYDNATGWGSFIGGLVLAASQPPGPAAPVITSSPTAAGTVGLPFGYTITASNLPVSFNASGLPQGLTLNTSNGVISGIPLLSGVFTITLSATNTTGTGTATLTLSIAGPAPLPPGTANFVTPTSLTTLRNDVTGWVGMEIQVASAPLTITALGRWDVPGNSDTHVLKLVDAASGNDLPNASVTLVMPPAVGSGSFVYATLASPVILSAGKTYYLVSGEVAGGDFWYDSSTTVETTNAGSVLGPVNFRRNWQVIAAPGQAFVPLDFRYQTGPAAPVITSSTTASAVAGSAFTYTITATNNPMSFNATGLPANLVLNTGTGVISGIPQSAGTYTVSLSAMNTSGTGTATLTLNVAQPPSAPPPPPVGTAAFVTSANLSAPRNDLSTWVGMVIQTGPLPVEVTALGRWVIKGSSGTHILKLVDAASGNDVPNASATLTIFPASAAGFAYAALSSPVVLNAGQTYYLVSQESAGGDFWYDSTTTVQTTSVAGVAGAVNFRRNWQFIPTPAETYGPLSFQYQVQATGQIHP